MRDFLKFHSTHFNILCLYIFRNICIARKHPYITKPLLGIDIFLKHLFFVSFISQVFFTYFTASYIIGNTQVSPSNIEFLSFFLFDNYIIFKLTGKAAFSSQQNRYKREATESMDEILFPTMDAAFPDEYEKLKRIATEVAESVNQFCRDSPNLPISSSPGVTLFTSLTPATPTSVPTTVVITSANASAASGISSPARPNKKFKKSSSCIKGSSNSNCTTSLNNGNITPSAGSSSTNSNTVSGNVARKERSLHYCNICSKGFKDKYSVNVHIRTHTGEKPFSCSLCGKSFRQKAHLAKHYQTHIAQKNSVSGATTKSSGKSRFQSGKQSTQTIVDA